MPPKKKSTPNSGTKRAAVKITPTAEEGVLFDRVVEILEQARAGVVRAVNSHMVLAYWMIGREIVQEIQGGKGRAAYGEAVLADLSQRLAARYGVGFSETTLQYFRKFYQVYADRHPQIRRPTGVESVSTPASTAILPNRHPAGHESLSGFSSQLSWSHYRALMRVEKPEAREFYEREAIAGGWDKRTLERQIHSFYYERLLKSQQPQEIARERRLIEDQWEAASDKAKRSRKT